jgi:hypothetical protein
VPCGMDVERRKVRHAVADQHSFFKYVRFGK